jgi:hypothetical protein
MRQESQKSLQVIDVQVAIPIQISDVELAFDVPEQLLLGDLGPVRVRFRSQ